MGYNVFVSYKYNDSSVLNLPGQNYTEVHDYVDALQDKLADEGQIYRGETSDEDLSMYGDDYIWNHLKDKIFYTSVTIVLISPNMKMSNRYDKSQWIPWEIYYSLRETPRSDTTSHRNAILAVVLPDSLGNYSYMLEQFSCCNDNCVLWHKEKLFTILRKNMFNQINKDKFNCFRGSNVYYGNISYINMITWNSFINDIKGNLDIAKSINDNIDNYELHLSVNE